MINQFFTITEGNGDITLPVELTSFTAKGSDSKVTPIWITETEINNQGSIF